MSSWIHISKNDSGMKDEWTGMAYYGYYATYNNYYAHSIGYYGIAGPAVQNQSKIIRSVFFLTTLVNYVLGIGTLSDPFIIS